MVNNIGILRIKLDKIIGTSFSFVPFYETFKNSYVGLMMIDTFEGEFCLLEINQIALRMTSDYTKEGI
jgi:hypothetical protein